MKWMFCILTASLISTPVLADEPRHNASAQSAAKPAVHQGAGKVVSMSADALTIKLSHEAIKSLGWPAMTMDFNVANAGLLKGLKAGDEVTFQLGKDASSDKWQIIRITQQGAKTK